MGWFAALKDYPFGAESSKKLNRQLVRGEERKRLRKFMKYLNAILARDSKVNLAHDPTLFKTQRVFSGPGLGTIPAALSQVITRVENLLDARV